MKKNIINRNGTFRFVGLGLVIPGIIYSVLIFGVVYVLFF